MHLNRLDLGVVSYLVRDRYLERHFISNHLGKVRIKISNSVILHLYSNHIYMLLHNFIPDVASKYWDAQN
jgi:hypothetical protein